MIIHLVPGCSYNYISHQNHLADLPSSSPLLVDEGEIQVELGGEAGTSGGGRAEEERPEKSD